MITPLDAAIRAGCDAHDRCMYPDCLKLHTMAGIECRTHKRQSTKTLRSLVEDPHLSISYECRETLRAHLGEG